MTAEDFHGLNNETIMRVRRKGGAGGALTRHASGRWCRPQSRWQTNAAVVAVICLVVFIQRSISSRSGGPQHRGGIGGSIRKPREKWITTSSQPFNEDGIASKAKNLIVVAGHSVTTSGHLEDADQDERDWFLLDYQKRKGLPSAIVLHIKAGIQAAHDDPSALLLFSGGETRAATGPETEGASYYRVADAMDLWTPPSQRQDGEGANDGAQAPRRISTVRARTVSEEFATDSFENLLFSICRFHEITGRYPEKITVVSFTFKRRRFETMHRPALRWPPSRFEYIGVDPPAETGFILQEATQGELENAAKPFENDPYGCHSPILQEKRRQRNPFSRTPPYALSCPDMKDLLHFCGPERIALDQVPWKTKGR